MEHIRLECLEADFHTIVWDPAEVNLLASCHNWECHRRDHAVYLDAHFCSERQVMLLSIEQMLGRLSTYNN